MNKMKNTFLFLAVVISFASCGGASRVKGTKLFKEDLAVGRVVDVTRVRKLIGSSSMLIFKKPKYGDMLEGYIRGIVTDYDNHPVEGVIVRAVLTQAQETKKQKKKKNVPSEEIVELQSELENAKKEEAGEGPNFDPGITDADGIYRIRFSFPVIDGRVDIKGKLLYNPGWSQQYDVLGQSYEPQVKESDFRLFYSERDKYLIFSEGVRYTVVRPVRNAEGKSAAISLKGAPKPETAVPTAKEPEKKPAARQPKKEEPKEDSGGDDFFKGFNFEP